MGIRFGCPLQTDILKLHAETSFLYFAFLSIGTNQMWQATMTAETAKTFLAITKCNKICTCHRIFLYVISCLSVTRAAISRSFKSLVSYLSYFERTPFTTCLPPSPAGLLLPTHPTPLRICRQKGESQRPLSTLSQSRY